MPLKTPPISSNDKKKNKNETSKKSKTEKTKKTDDLDAGSPNKSFDSKEEFFRLMSEKINKDNDKSEDSESKDDNKDSSSDSIKLKKGFPQYKKMVFRFSFLVLILLLIVFYFSFVTLNIIVYADKEVVEENLNFYAYSEEEEVDMERAIPASIDKVELEASNTFTSTGEKKLGGEIIGKVTIINEYSRNQPLVATTRLLNSDDKLFRIQDTVNVPAGGSVEVEIYADEPSEDMAIAPDKFIIPGLWSGLQDKIYAESYESFTLKQDVEKYITQDDFSKAIDSLNENILQQAQNNVNIEDKSKQDSIISIDDSQTIIESDKEVGDKAEFFDIKVKNLVNIITFDNDDVLDIVSRRLEMLDFNLDFVEVDLDSFDYLLSDFNSEQSLAEIKTTFLIETSLGGPDEGINKSYLTNLNKEQIETYLDNIEEIKSYELLFKPSFIKRSPLLSDRINIEYK